MYISMNTYQRPQFSFMSHSGSTASKEIKEITKKNITDATLLALDANLKALTAKIGYETVHSISLALKGDVRKPKLNVVTAVDECISEIVSEEKLKNDLKLRAKVFEMKANALQDIANMLKLIL